MSVTDNTSIIVNPRLSKGFGSPKLSQSELVKCSLNDALLEQLLGDILFLVYKLTVV